MDGHFYTPVTLLPKKAPLVVTQYIFVWASFWMWLEIEHTVSSTGHQIPDHNQSLHWQNRSKHFLVHTSKQSRSRDFLQAFTNEGCDKDFIGITWLEKGRTQDSFKKLQPYAASESCANDWMRLTNKLLLKQQQWYSVRMQVFDIHVTSVSAFLSEIVWYSLLSTIVFLTFQLNTTASKV